LAAVPVARRDAQGPTFAPLPPPEEIMPCRPGEYDGLPLWVRDDADEVDAYKVDGGCGDARDAFFASLIAPISADALDLSGAFPAIWEVAALAVNDEPVAGGRAARRPVACVGARSPLARGSVRLARFGAHRPAVRIPGRRVPAAPDTTAPRTANLPPLWMLANIVILLVAGFTILPRVAAAEAAAGCRWYSVRPGDTLGDLGWTYHSTALKLAAANHIANPNLIYIGQQLCIPITADGAAPSAPQAPAKSSPPHFGSATGVKSFISFVLPSARSAARQTGWPVSLLLAQWGLEQGWHVPGYTGYNFGNCGAIPGEPTVGGLNIPGSPAAFSYARTPADGVRQYVHVAHLGYYAAVAPTAARWGVDAAARALGRSPWDAGHYTGIGDPGSSLLAILHTYNLYWYDSH
jgi:hypothetical protein